ncbi:signal recognition particle-docking protein FtsY [Psychrobacter sp. ANT_H3]|nr:signal recognition particle-docking protein FtsY [Psychrobacter sp. ANT_H3]MDA5134263.1 signal recognition particle-docking protein FtsY [Psychrobacter sp. ANT_H3]
MNNPNNSNRVVINLDGGLDDLDDDDITLPSLPAQTVPIVDASDSVASSNTEKSDAEKSNTADMALGTPIVEIEKQSSSENTLEATANTNTNAISSQSTTTIPTMPLQDHLGDRPSATSATGDTSAINKAQTEIQQLSAAPEESQESQESQESKQTEENKKKGGWFNRMKTGLSKSRKNLAEGMVSILIGGKEIDDELLEEVEDQLLVADIGVNATNRIIKSLTEQTARGDLIYAHSLYKALQTELVDILTPKVAPLVIDTSKKPFVILVVGVNGVGKTTTIGKLAKRLQGEGKSVMLAAGDTFRAAATEQLQIWGERNNIPVVAQGHGSDSASVIFDAMQSAKAKNIDVLIADTAGRLQNKTHLMAELEKVVRVMRKADPSAPHEGMIVLDAGTGQNAINQVELFNKVVPLTGITITKLDGTAKGGVVFNIAETSDVPIRYIGVGESIDDLRTFSPKQFVAALFETDDKE